MLAESPLFLVKNGNWDWFYYGISENSLMLKTNFELPNLQYAKLNFTFTLVMDYMLDSVLFVYEKQTLDFWEK